MKLFSRKKKEKVETVKKEKPIKVIGLKKKERKFIEDEFNNERIILPTDVRDYVDIEEFEQKTKSLPAIQKQIEDIKEEVRAKKMMEETE